MQPIIYDQNDVIRFKRNVIVDTLLEQSRIRGYGLNEMPFNNFTQDDIDQFFQLVGYSVSGYCGLDLVSEAAKDAARVAVKKFKQEEATES